MKSMSQTKIEDDQESYHATVHTKKNKIVDVDTPVRKAHLTKKKNQSNADTHTHTTGRARD
jgi:hypothetical protein